MASSGRMSTGNGRDAQRRRGSEAGGGFRRRGWVALVLLLGLLGAAPSNAQVVNEDCLAVILNRVTQVNADGFYVIPNIPVPVGLVRARVVCLQNGTTYRGHTEFRQMVVNANTNFGDFIFDDSEPIPVTLALTAAGPTSLDPVVNTTQLVTTGELVDGTLVDLTGASTGTSYTSSNDTIATVDAEGLVTGVSSGNVLVTARNEGQVASIAIGVVLDSDSDNDGMPDDYEQLNAVNPGGANLARMNGAVADASSNLSSYPPSRVRDGSLQTSWFTGIGDAANLRSAPWVEIVLPRDIDLAQVRIFGNRQSPDGFDFFAGIVTAYDDLDAEVFDSGEVELPAPDRDQAVAVDLDGIRRVRFTATDDESNEPGLSEIELIERPGGQGLDENDGGDAVLDFDSDGLTNLQEFEAGSSPFLIDTDGDRLTDLEEATIGSNPLLPDTDGDGLQDGDELNRTSDTDNDGLINILDMDSDGDSLPDGVEIDIGTSPLNADTDNNGLPDGSEDTDLDNIPNLEELLENTDPTNPDTDDDGLLDGEEVVAGDDGFITDPLRPDTDGDGMWDGYESEYGLDPTDPSDAGNDEEPDGLTNLQEFFLGSDPFDPDTTPPGVTSVEPVDGGTLPANEVVVVRFNEAMRPDSLTTETVSLLQDGEPVDGVVTPSGDNLSATFNPADTLDVGVFITVRVQDARDTAGNRMLGVVETEFLTDVPIDTTAPDVSSTTPVNNATGVPTNAPFTVQFNERIDPSTLTTSCLFVIDRVTNQNVPGMVQVDPSGRVASFVPDAPYAVSRAHYGRLNQNCIQDLAGFFLPYHNFSFTTAFEEDEDRPALVQTAPADGALAIPVNALVVLEFDEPVGLLGAVAGISVEANGELVPGSVALSGGNRRVTFTSLTALDADTIHTVTVGTEVTDLAGFPVENPGSFSFTTSDSADIVRPAIVGFTPGTNAGGVGTNTSITIAFSERINPITLNEATFTLTENVQSTRVSGQVDVAPDLMSVTFTPDEPLAPFTQHTRTLSYAGITDYTAQTLSTSNYTRSFTTGIGPDDVPPQVELVGPADGQADVPATTVVTVLVDETLDALSIADDAVLLLNGEEVVEGSLTRSGRSFTFTPDELLDASTTYTVDVDGFTDVVGNPVVPFVSSFSTGNVPGGNLARAAQVTHDVSSTLNSSYVPGRGTDGNLNTEWCLGSGDTANSGDSPYYEVVLPGDSYVTEIRFRGRRASNGTEIFAGIFQLFDSEGTELWNSGEQLFPPPAPRDLDVSVPGGRAGVRRARMTVTQDESNNPCMAELEVVGTYDDPTLGQMVDAGRPSSISMTPGNGAVDVPLDSNIVVEFNEPVSPATVSASTLTVKLLDLSGTPTVPGTYAVAGPTVTFTPSLPLPQSQRIRVSVTSSIRDLSGNQSNTVNRTFTTVTEVDDIPPTVVMVTPEDGAADVGRTTPISITFSEPINPATVNANTFALFVNGAEVTTSLSRSSDNTVVTLTRSPLEANAYFTVVATSGVEDLSGNALADFASSFSTVETFDTGRPSIVTVRPGNGATRVAADTPIVLYANEALDAASVQAGLFVSENGSLIPGAISTASGEGTIEFLADTPFVPGATVQVFATTAITDSEGNALNSLTSTFTVTPDPASETAFVEELRPASGVSDVPTNTVLEVRYSEQIDPSTVNNLTVRLFPSGLPEQALTVSVVGDGRVIRAEPSGDLAPSRYHSWQVVGVNPLDGGSLNDLYANFTTAADPDLDAPALRSISPPDGAEGVGVNARIWLRFDEPLNPMSVSEASLQIAPAGGDPLPRTVSFSNGDKTVTLTPHAPLADLTFYDVTIDGLTDVAGNPLAPTATSFTTTVGPDVTNPDVSKVNPPNASTSVSTNTVVEVEYNDALDPASVGSGTIYITRSGLPPVTGVSSLGSDGRTVTFVPDEPLAIGLRHDIRVQSVFDLTGNTQPTRYYYFTTSFVEDPDGPEVLAITPDDGLTDVPTNAQVTVQFDEPLSPLGLMGGVALDGGSGPVQAVVSLSDGNRRVTVQPLLPLEADTLHSVTIDGVMDRTGNTLAAPVTSEFTTGPGVDLFQPVVTAFNPPHNVGGVSTETEITIEFSERINPITLRESTLRLQENVQNSYIPGTVTVAPDLMSATFTPDGPLAPYTRHTWYLSYTSIKDLTVQTLTSSNNNRSFTTGAGNDDVAPQVESVSPADAAAEVPTNAVVKLRIDEALDLLALEDGTLTLDDGGPVEGDYTLSGRTFTFTPAEELGASTTYTISISGFRDRAGNVMVPFSSTFTTRTVPAGNIARASQVVLNPSSFLSSSYVPSRAVDGRYDLEWCLGSGDTAANGSPYFEMILPGDATVDEIRFFGRTASNGTEIFAGTFELFAADDTPLYASPSERIFPPPAPRGWVESVGGVTGVRRVRFNITQDESNNPCMGELEVIGSFDDPTLGQFRDAGKPSLVSMTPSNGSLDVSVDSDIVLEFNEPVSPVSVTATSLLVRFIDVSGSPTVPGSFDVSGSTVVFTPAATLPNNTRIQVHVSASVQDLVGNTANSVSWYITTGSGADVTGPAVVMVTPEHGATDVGRTTPISITFDEPLNPSTVTNDTFAIFANGSELSKTISRSSDNTVVTLSLTLPAASEIVVIGTDAVKDLSGNPASGFVSVFDTTSNLDLTRPSVVTLRPGSGSARVDADTLVVLYANEDLDPTSVQQGLFVSQNGEAVAGSISTATGANTMVFTPDAPFDDGTVVQVFATTTIRDTDGNALNNYQGSFTIAPDSASENARPLDAAPINSATGVPTNVVMEVRYSEPLDPATVNNLTVRLFPSGLSEQALDVTLSDGNRVIRAEPTAELSTDRYHSWQVVGVGAQDGGGFNDAYYNFTTGAGADVTAPAIVSISPVDGSPDVGVNATVWIRFDERVNPLSVTAANTYLEGNEGVVATTVGFSNSDRTVVLTPQAPLVDEAPYTVNVGGITDLAGNAVTATTSSFDTRVGPDTASPSVQRFSPANGTTGVPTSTLVEIEFNEPIDFGTVGSSDFTVTPSGQSAVAGAISAGADDRTLLFVPDAPLATSLWHSVYVQNISDRTGNNMTAKSFSFTTGDVADSDAPVLLRTSPADGETGVPTNARVMVEFDEPVNEVELGDQVTLTVGGSPVAASVSTENGRRWVVLRPTLPLTPNTDYRVTVDGVEDRSGNVLAASEVVDFTTGGGPSLVQGRILSHNPITNATDVPTNSVVTLIFSKAVNPIMLSTSTFRLRDNGAVADVTGSVSVAPDGLSAVFTPDAPLAASTSHTYTFQYNQVTDLTGVTFSSTEWSRNFTTGEAVDTDGPTVSLLSPQDQAVDVPVNVFVDVLMDEKLDPLSVGTDAVLLFDGATPVEGTASRIGNWQLRFTPSEHLRASTTYTIDVDGFTDVAGNPVVPFQGDFTTGSVPESNIARASEVELNPISTYSASWVPSRAVDGNLGTSWFSLDPPFAEDPFFEIILPGDATVDEFRIFGNRSHPTGHDIVTADFQLFGADDSLLFSSTSVSLPAPDNDAVVVPGDPVTGVRRARFTGTVYDNNDLGISEFELIGAFDDPGLARFPDNVKPSVAVRTPDSGAVDVPVDSLIEVEFNDQLNPITVSATNLPITISNVQVAGTYAVNGAVVTFTPDENLPATSTVRVRVTANVRDIANNQANTADYNFLTE